MRKNKLNLAYISNNTMRKATFKRRKKGFMKKIHELSVLCGIEACAIIHNPFNSNLEVWPSNSEVKNVVEKFELKSLQEEEKKKVNHERFLRQSISKTMENNNQEMKTNDERTMKEVMFQILDGKEETLMLNDRNRVDLCNFIDKYIEGLIHHSNETLNWSHIEYGESSSDATFMLQRAVADMDSSSAPNTDVFNPPRPALSPKISSNHIPSQVNSFVNNILPMASDQQCYYPMMNSVGVYGQDPNLNVHSNQYQQQFEYPTVSQDGIYNQSQNQNQHGVDSSLFPNPDVFNTPRPTTDLLDMSSIISSNHRPGQINTFVSNVLPLAYDQQSYYPMMNLVGVHGQHPNLNANHNQYQQPFEYPIVDQNRIYNPNQNQIQQEEWLVEQMMNHHEERYFPLTDDSNRYYHQQP